jgi:hypothetical protein
MEEARVAFHTTTTARKAHIGGNGENDKHQHWILDSGPLEYCSPKKRILTDYKKVDEPIEVNTAKGQLHGIGTGSVHLTVDRQSGDPIPITLHEVLYVPGMDSNLLSSNVLLGKPLEISMHSTRGINILLSDYIVAKTVPHSKL